MTAQAQLAEPGKPGRPRTAQFWQGKVPARDGHRRAHGAAGADVYEFALRTTDGGALVFYTDAAELTITPPAGEACA